MNREMERLGKLIKAQDSLLEMLLRDISKLKVSILDCDKELERMLHSMDTLQHFGLAKGPDFGKLLRGLNDQRRKIQRVLRTSVDEHVRMSRVNEHLNERLINLHQARDAIEQEELMEDWISVQADIS